jgi:hypothetical protein
MSRKIYLNGAFSYKQVCEKLHVEPKRGRAQQTHIQKLHKTHNFEERKLNATRKLYIFHDGDKDNKVTSGYEDFDLTITSGYIRYLVYRTLLERKHQVLDLTLDDIRKQLHICNNNYEFALYNADKTTVIKEAVHLPQMTRELNEYIRKQIHSALDTLEHRYCVLMFEEVYKYQEDDTGFDDGKGRSVRAKWKSMTDDQSKLYVDIQQKLLPLYVSEGQSLDVYNIPQEKIPTFYQHCLDIFNERTHINSSKVRKVFHIINVKKYSDKVCRSQIDKYNKELLSHYQKHGAYMMKQYVNKSKAMNKYSIRDKRTAKNMFGENPHRDFQQEYIDNVTTN